MLLEFSLGNYRSFNTIQTLDFRATSLVSDNKEVDTNNIVEKGESRILKTIGLYGPNGSGKSNLISGLRTFCRSVESSLESEAIMDFAAEPFKLASEIQEHFGFFQVQLLVDSKKYRYGFTLGLSGFVLEEWLFGPAEKNETWYFKRTLAKIECNKEWFEEGHNVPTENLRPNTLFLTFVSAFNGQLSQAVRGTIAKNISFEGEYYNSEKMKVSNGRFGIGLLTRYIRLDRLTNQLVKDGKVDIVLQWLKSVGLLYESITLDEGDKDFERVLLQKIVFDKDGTPDSIVEMDLDSEESAGTKKFYYSIGRLLKLFTEGGLWVSDEIDNNFHPSLLQRIIRFFNDPSINKAGAQLLFTSHDTNVLQPEILRRDQIYFTEKSLKEETILYSLADLKGIRNNADFARQYLAGFYGALPVLSNYKNLSIDSPPQ